MKTVRFFGILILSFSLSACASFNQKLKSWISGKPAATEQEARRDNYMKYSENPDVMTGPKRQYKRVTRERLEDEALLQSNAGSLWVMEGQGAYLFSQNIVRLVGDPIGVVLEGEPKEQLEAKVDVIGKLLQKLEMKAQAKLRQPSSESEDKKSKTKKKTDGSEEENQQASKPPIENFAPSEFKVKTVPTRIVERTVDGNYRVKGSQPFMIGSREYKIIVTGVVRAEDFNDEGISSTKLLDPKFDIVSVRKKEPES